MKHAGKLVQAGVRVIDLSADFRLHDANTWTRWYGIPHADTDLLVQAVYGLPELNRERIASAKLVANPGCYPTAIILALIPLIEQKCIDTQDLIANAASGISGAGRKAVINTLYTETCESFKAYSVAGHRHLPEICQVLTQAGGGKVGLTFIPHLAPMARGIHATLYAKLTGEVDLQKLYEKRYKHEPFVDVMQSGSHPETRSVRGSNYCRLAAHRLEPGKQVVVLSVIDNLVKGGAGQAIQNMNLMFGFDENAGLDMPALAT
jgi:N-acetyl-gamma-glutamyl-phosphate reductase